MLNKVKTFQNIYFYHVWFHKYKLVFKKLNKTFDAFWPKQAPLLLLTFTKTTSNL